MVESPDLSRRRRPQPAKDDMTDSAEISTTRPESSPVQKAAASEAAASLSIQDLLAPQPQIPVTQFNTRIAVPYKNKLEQLSVQTGRTLRDLVELAIEHTYGRPEDMPPKG